MNRKWLALAMLVIALMIVVGVVVGLSEVGHAIGGNSIDCPGGTPGVGC